MFRGHYSWVNLLCGVYVAVGQAEIRTLGAFEALMGCLSLPDSTCFRRTALCVATLAETRLRATAPAALKYFACSLCYSAPSCPLAAENRVALFEQGAVPALVAFLRGSFMDADAHRATMYALLNLAMNQRNKVPCTPAPSPHSRLFFALSACIGLFHRRPFVFAAWKEALRRAGGLVAVSETFQTSTDVSLRRLAMRCLAAMATLGLSSLVHRGG